MKRYLIPLTVVLLIAGIFFGYHTWDKNRNINAWELVPKDAFLVYESTDFWTVWQSLDSIKTWQGLKNIPAFAHVSKDLAYLDSLGSKMNAGKSEFSALFDANPLLVALFITAAHDFDFLYTLEIKTLEQHTILSQFVDAFSAQGKKTTRNYLGKTISEIEKNNRKFTYIYHKNFFIGSFTPFLVEDAIRTISEGEGSGFVAGKSELFKLAKLAKDHGNVYINLSMLGRMAEVFTDRLHVDLSALNQLADIGFLDIRFDPDAVVLNGFTLIPQDGNTILSTFANNPGVPFSLQGMIPNGTSHVIHLSFQDFKRWQEAWHKLPFNAVHNIEAARQQITKTYDIDVAAYAQWLGSEIALINLEAGTSLNDLKLIAIATPDIGEALLQLNVTTDRLAKVTGDTAFNETYADRAIREIKISDLPLLLFGSPFTGFESTFYMAVDGHLVFANSIQALKILIDDIENENTWGKSVRMLSYLETLNKESNLSVIVNTSRAWNKISKVLNADWSKTFEQQATTLRGYETLAAQFSNIDNKYYTNIVLSHPGAVDAPRATKVIKPEKSITFPNAIVTRPFFGRNAANKALELSIQDENGQFYHISNDFQVIWNDSLPSSIISEVLQFDYYKNNKLQFLFATEKQVFGIDRTGTTLPDYPINNPSSDPIKYLTLIDYDKSKNYRISLVDTKGKIWLMDKTGAKLEGWSPKDFEHVLAAPPTHVRVGGKDLVLVSLANGMIHLVNRKGDISKGFPIDLKGELSNPFFIELGSNFDRTRFTTITDGGELIQFTANGEITKKEQLIKSSATSKFQLVPDALNTGFVISKIDEYRVSMLDARGKELFMKDYIDSKNLIFQYYNFGAGNEIIVITDRDQAFSYLFDKSGSLINFQPIQSDHAIGLMYFESTREYKVYKAYMNELSLMSLKR